MTQPTTLTIAGPTHARTDLAGHTMARCANRLGWHVFGLPEENVAADYADVSLNISQNPIGCLNEKIDLLVCLDAAAWERYVGMLNADAIILADADNPITLPRRKKLRVIRLPIARLAREIGGHPRTRSSVIAGAVASLAEIPFIDLQSALESGLYPNEILGHMRAARAAHQAIQEQAARLAMPASSPGHTNLVLTGAQAAALGAAAAGVTFIATSPFVNSLASEFDIYQKNLPLVLQQTANSDEAANQAIGAAMAGARSLVISDGSIEALADSFRAAAVSEAPLVLLHFATSCINKRDQQQLLSATSMGGDVPHVVLAPASPEEVFTEMTNAFNIAENLQTPVIVMCDEYVKKGFVSTPDLSSLKTSIQRGQLLTAKQAQAASSYARYQVTSNGISPRKLPGQPGDLFNVSAFDHDIDGLDGSVTDNVAQTDKRLRKTSHLLASGLPYKIYGPTESEVTLVCFGSTVSAALQASQILNQHEISTKVLQIVFLAPFPATQIHQIFRGSKHLMLIEANATAQLGQLVRQETGIGLHHKVLTVGGEYLYPEKIVKQVKRAFTHA